MNMAMDQQEMAKVQQQLNEIKNPGAGEASQPAPESQEEALSFNKPVTLEEEQAKLNEEAKPKPVEKTSDDVRAEIEKIKSSMQKRIDQQTAKLHKLESELASKTSHAKEDTQEDDVRYQIAEERKEYVDRKSEIQWEKEEARADGERAKFNKLVKEEAKIDTLLKRLDDRYWEVERTKEARKVEAGQEKNLTQWGDAWSELMNEFPELAGEDGRLNRNSAIFVEAIKLMESNPRKPKWATFAQRINAKYDNPNGPFLAVYEAARKLERSSQERTPVARQQSSDGFKRQATTGGSGGGHIAQRESTTDRKLEELIYSVNPTGNQGRGMRMHNARQALEAIKKKNNINTRG